MVELEIERKSVKGIFINKIRIEFFMKPEVVNVSRMTFPPI